MTFKSQLRTTSFGLSILFLALLAGCGQTVDRDPGTGGVDRNPSTAEETPTPVPSNTPNPSVTPIPTASPIPTAFGEAIGQRSFAIVVNKTMAVVGEENGNHYAQLRTLNGISSPGAYYGIGFGNKGFIGFGVGYHGTPVSEFENISFRTYEPTTNRPVAYNVYLNLLVDLNCDPLKPDYVIVMTPNLGGKAKGTWNTWHISKNDAMFRTPGGKGGLPDSQTRSAPAPLTRMVQAKPRACFVATDVFGVGMKRNQKMAPFQIVHGDSIYLQPSAVRIDDIDLRMTNSALGEDFE
jgi:hypothetical protein